MKLGEILETYRKSKGLSYEALARQIGMEHTHLFKIIKGQYSNPSLHTLMPLMNWLVGK